MKFNAPDLPGDMSPDSFDMNEFAQLGAISAVSDFINEWVDDGYATAGGDIPELHSTR